MAKTGERPGQSPAIVWEMDRSCVLQYNDSRALCGLRCHRSQELIRLSYILLQLSVHSYWDFSLPVIETGGLMERL